MVPKNDVKHREEFKRDALWDPVVRWRAMQEFITRADSQAAVPRSRPPVVLNWNALY